jgi:hypothetical protein
MNINKVLVLVSLILFILAGLGVSILPNTIAWASACFVGSFLV